jgi:hypothetical protein
MLFLLLFRGVSVFSIMFPVSFFFIWLCTVLMVVDSIVLYFIIYTFGFLWKGSFFSGLSFVLVFVSSEVSLY